MDGSKYFDSASDFASAAINSPVVSDSKFVKPKPATNSDRTSHKFWSKKLLEFEKLSYVFYANKLRLLIAANEMFNLWQKI